MGKTKGNVVWAAVRGFVIGILLIPVLPFMLAYEGATEARWK